MSNTIIKEQPTDINYKDFIAGLMFTTLIIAATLKMPLLSFIFSFIIPLPIFFYRTKLGRKAAFVLLGLSLLVILSMVENISFDLFFFVELLLLGFVLAEFIEKKLTIEEIAIYTAGILIFIGFAGLFYYSLLCSKGLIQMVSEYVHQNLLISLNLSKKISMSQDHIMKLSESMDEIKFVIVRIIPALFISFMLLIIWVNLLIGKMLFQIKKLSFPEFGNLKEWKTPDILVWGLIGSGTLMLLPFQFLKLAGLNVIIVLMVIYFFQGIAIVSYFFEKKEISQVVKVCFYSFIAIHHISLLLITCLGLFDIWGDFRKLNNIDDTPLEI